MKMSILVEKQFACVNSACSVQFIGIGRRRGPVQPSNFQLSGCGRK